MRESGAFVNVVLVSPLCGRRIWSAVSEDDSLKPQCLDLFVIIAYFELLCVPFILLYPGRTLLSVAVTFSVAPLGAPK